MLPSLYRDIKCSVTSALHVTKQGRHVEQYSVNVNVSLNAEIVSCNECFSGLFFSTNSTLLNSTGKCRLTKLSILYRNR